MTPLRRSNIPGHNLVKHASGIPRPVPVKHFIFFPHVFIQRFDYEVLVNGHKRGRDLIAKAARQAVRQKYVLNQFGKTSKRIVKEAIRDIDQCEFGDEQDEFKTHPNEKSVLDKFKTDFSASYLLQNKDLLMQKTKIEKSIYADEKNEGYIYIPSPSVRRAVRRNHALRGQLKRKVDLLDDIHKPNERDARIPQPDLISAEFESQQIEYEQGKRDSMPDWNSAFKKHMYERAKAKANSAEPIKHEQGRWPEIFDDPPRPNWDNPKYTDRSTRTKLRTAHTKFGLQRLSTCSTYIHRYRRHFSIALKPEVNLNAADPNSAARQKFAEIMTNVNYQEKDELNKTALSSLFGEASNLPELKVKSKLVSGEIVKDFNKYVISSEFDFDMGVDVYAAASNKLLVNPSRMRLLVLATHYARFSSRIVPSLMVNISTFCQETSQPLLFLNLFYLFFYRGKIGVPEFELALQFLEKSQMRNEIVNIFTIFQKKIRRPGWNLERIKPILADAIVENKDDFGLLFETMRTFLDSYSYIENSDLSAEENTRREKIHLEFAKLVKSEFISFIFSLSVEHGMMSYARVIMSDMIQAPSIGCDDFLNMFILAASDMSLLNQFTRFGYKFLKKREMRMDEPSIEFTERLVATYEKNDALSLRHTNILVKMFNSLSLPLTENLFQRILVLLGRLDQFDALVGVLRGVQSSRAPVHLTEQTRILGVKIANQCVLETTRSIIIGQITSIRDSKQNITKEEEVKFNAATLSKKTDYSVYVYGDEQEINKILNIELSSEIEQKLPVDPNEEIQIDPKTMDVDFCDMFNKYLAEKSQKDFKDEIKKNIKENANVRIDRDFEQTLKDNGLAEIIEEIKQKEVKQVSDKFRIMGQRGGEEGTYASFPNFKTQLRRALRAIGEKRSLVDPKNPSHKNFVIMKKIWDSRPLISRTGLVIPIPKKRIKRSQRPDRDRRNLFEQMVETMLMGREATNTLLQNTVTFDESKMAKEIKEKSGQSRKKKKKQKGLEED